MTWLNLTIKGFFHYLKSNLTVAVGVAISTAVLTGALIIGDSISNSLEQITNLRLGKTTHTITSADKYFRSNLASDIEKKTGVLAVPLLLSEAVAVSDGGTYRANRVQVVGLNSSFGKIANTDKFEGLERNEILISENLVNRLSVSVGDNILLRIKKESLIPLNAPFISNTESSVSFRATIKAISNKGDLGRFSLKNSQTAPFNVFMSIERLNELMEFKGKANSILIVSEQTTDSIKSVLRENWTPEDASLIYREIDKTGESEVLSERVFMEPNTYDVFGTQPGARGVLTYFVNSAVKISAKGKNSRSVTPYSFVSTMPENKISENEMVINKWMADDLNAKTGDLIQLKYFTIGPLRKLKEDSCGFVVKSVVSMESHFADETLMPFLPGLSDAGSCREWEAGVPIDLDKIRDKDEKYWDKFKGTPKAFISVSKAQQIWSNRFGNYTSVRFPSHDFTEVDFEKVFHKQVSPMSLGFVVTAVKEKGMFAAQNGVDFSQLFLGLSFFLLVAAILLSALLFLLNLENRMSQIGTLTTLGFKAKQVRQIYLTEGLIVSVIGSLAGLLIAVLYTLAVFKALNSLWYDIVRTEVLQIKIEPLTLIVGFIISVVLSIFVIQLAVRNKMNQQISDIQKKIKKKEKKWLTIVKVFLGILLCIVSIAIIIEQFLLNESQNPTFFFMSGAMMLIALLIFAERFLIYQEKYGIQALSLSGLSIRNTARNRNRSLTILILFAIGTFLVISTGVNKQDMFSNSSDKSSGTGGFLLWAETTMPVLFNINDKTERAKEGLVEDFNVVQFRKIEGDDASCLNLNRISNPAILGVDIADLTGRFSFATSIPGFNQDNPWASLNDKTDEQLIPAIADQTVIQWGLGKKVGDTLFYQNELGDTLNLKLVAGLAASVFQGYLIISNNNFLKHYPSSSGSTVFLIDGGPHNKEAISHELQMNFRDFGWEQMGTAERLAGFYSVTNTYLSIFLALGALALILGTIGLAVVLARSILERKSEIALLMAIGFSRNKVFKLIAREYLILLIAGVLIGLITSVTATLPSFISTYTGVSIGSIVIIIGIIFLNGLIWITVLTRISLNKKNIILALKAE